MTTATLPAPVAVLAAWAVARLREPSTWAGLITVFCTLLGREITPAYADLITILGTTVASAVCVVTHECPAS